ncbi:MAG TPA: DUF4124 domain-containing protein [Pseudomonadales bacterium]
MRFVCKIGLTLCALPLLMGATIYRWVDENGVVNYTQLKPEGVPAELVHADTGQRVTSEPAAGADRGLETAPTKEGEPLTEAQQRMLEELRAAEQERQRQVAKVRESNCQQARDLLERLTSHGRLRVTGEDGEARVMPEEERQQRIEQAQRAVAVNCTNTASR